MQNKHSNKKRNNELDDKIVNIVADGNVANSEINHNKAYDVEHSDIFGR